MNEGEKEWLAPEGFYTCNRWFYPSENIEQSDFG